MIESTIYQRSDVDATHEWMAYQEPEVLVLGETEGALIYQFHLCIQHEYSEKANWGAVTWCSLLNARALNRL